MVVIGTKNLTKEFKVKVKKKGLKNFFKPEYKVVRAVDNLSLKIEAGESVALIGPNGAGKSTTIKMLTGILYPTSGEISVLGVDPTKKRIKLSYEIGSVVGQKEQLWIHISPYENFKFFGTIYDLKKEELENRIKELVDLFEVNDYLHQSVKSLSLGQRMRCEMIASLLHNPKILFFDEPTIGMDPLAKDTLRKLIKKINKELKTTIIFTSHDVGDIEEVCKRVIIINNGKVVLDDSMKNLKYHYLNKKIIEVKLKKEMKLKEKEGYKILKNIGNAFLIEIDMEKTSIEEVLSLFEASLLEDISISSTPLETIIKEIYAGSK